MRFTNYIGVTGFANLADLEVIPRLVKAAPATHRIMAGVLVSYKTLRGEAPPSPRYAPGGGVEEILRGAKEAGAWPVVHYNSRSGDLGAELERLVERFPAMEGIQLNIVAPDPYAIRDFNKAHPNIEVILQVNGASLVNGAISAAEYVERYLPHGIRHALIDPSGGRGRALSMESIASLYDVWGTADDAGVRMGIAGGLGPKCAGLLQRIAVRLRRADGPDVLLSQLSYDAESRVRVPLPGGEPGARHWDALSADLAVAYVNAVASSINSFQPGASP